MIDPRDQFDWACLFRLAVSLIHQVNFDTLIIDGWTFGGGTLMMLQIDHRESRDVDIFLQDHQLLPFLDPDKRDFEFEIPLIGHSGDDVTFRKLSFGIGEIDFIVAQPKTADPTRLREVEGEQVLLETVPEIIIKKIVHRGSTIQPRDIFDIAAAREEYSDRIVSDRSYRDDVQKTIEALNRLNPEFVNRALSEMQIRERFVPVADTALERTKEILLAV